MRIVPILLALAVAPAVAADPDAGLYQAHCAGCHGLGGAGDGPLSHLLTVPVPDLTQLTVRNGGVFPLAEVVRAVDGRQIIAGHGGPMPVFGPMLGGGSAVIDAADGTPIQTRGAVLQIVRYVQSLQE